MLSHVLMFSGKLS